MVRNFTFRLVSSPNLACALVLILASLTFSVQAKADDPNNCVQYLFDALNNYPNRNDAFTNGILKPLANANPSVDQVRGAIAALNLPDFSDANQVQNYCRVSSAQIGSDLRAAGFNARPTFTTLPSGQGHHAFVVGNVLVDPTVAQVGLPGERGVLVVSFDQIRNNSMLATIYGEAIGMTADEITAVKNRPMFIDDTPGGRRVRPAPVRNRLIGTPGAPQLSNNFMAAGGVFVTIPGALMTAGAIVAFQNNTACRMNRRENQSEIMAALCTPTPAGLNYNECYILQMIRAVRSRMNELTPEVFFQEVAAAWNSETSSVYTRRTGRIQQGIDAFRANSESDEDLARAIYAGTSDPALGDMIRAYGYRLLLAGEITTMRSNGCGSILSDNPFCQPASFSSTTPAPGSVSYGRWLLVQLNDTEGCGALGIRNPNNVLCVIDVVVDLDTGLFYPATLEQNGSTPAYGNISDPNAFQIGTRYGNPRTYALTDAQRNYINAAMATRRQCRAASATPTPTPVVTVDPNVATCISDVARANQWMDSLTNAFTCNEAATARRIGNYLNNIMNTLSASNTPCSSPACSAAIKQAQRDAAARYNALLRIFQLHESTFCSTVQTGGATPTPTVIATATPTLAVMRTVAAPLRPTPVPVSAIPTPQPAAVSAPMGPPQPIIAPMPRQP